MSDVIALVFDFDDTLAPDSTTGFLESLGVDTAAFWKESVGPLLSDEDWDPVPAYLYRMIELSRAGAHGGPITQEKLREWGRRLPLHDGVHRRQAGARRHLCRLEGMRVEQRVGIQFEIALGRRVGLQIIQVLRRVHAQKIVALRLRRTDLAQEVEQAAGQQLVIDGVQARRALGMPLPHLMQTTCRVGNI